jgi:transcriptional regulator with XRE-family HTH domain
LHGLKQPHGERQVIGSEPPRAMLPPMPSRERRIPRAAWLMQRDLQELGDDYRNARLNAGLTLREVARQVGVSPASIFRVERARPPGARPDLLSRHAATVGLRVRVRAYPDGDPIRDAASIRLIGAFRARLPADYRFRPEVPVSGVPGDLRAWDGVLDLPGCRCATEFVTRFHDCQAQLRAFELKLRDGAVDRLVIVVMATHANRRALSVARDIVAAAFPLKTRQVMAALSAGRDPGGNGVVLLAAPPRDALGGTASL